jgi:hypothetical protein
VNHDLSNFPTLIGAPGVATCSHADDCANIGQRTSSSEAPTVRGHERSGHADAGVGTLSAKLALVRHSLMYLAFETF